MHDHDTQSEEREKWRARILRALAELRHDQVHLGGGTSRDEAPSGGDGSRAAARR
ncbi:MAG TPA: hypothetical protein VIF62_02000 [Labilithrix sp.]|jgi:hypothetical protein